MDALEVYRAAVARADAGEHERTGGESMFTSSKAYNTLPFAPRGHPGLWAGPLAAGTGRLRRPAYGSTRDVVRGGVFPQAEREVDAFTEALFAYGNRMEPQILRWFGQLPDVAACAGGGRVHHPTVPWMSSTPDGFAVWRGRPVVLELKAPSRRRVEPGPTEAWVAARDGGRFRQDNLVLEEEDEDGERRQVVGAREWEHVRVVEGSRVPAHYLVQCTLHCVCAGIPDALVVQAESGGVWPPTLHLTHWRLDRDLLEALLPYWTRVWGLVEAGRAAVRAGERLPESWPWPRDGDETHAAVAPFDWASPAVARLEARSGNI